MFADIAWNNEIQQQKDSDSAVSCNFLGNLYCDREKRCFFILVVYNELQDEIKIIVHSVNKSNYFT